MNTLFHYCPSSSFTSIISNRTIWLSSLSLSNDSMEGRLVAQTFERLLSQSNVSPEEMAAIRASLKIAEDVFDGLGFCLSEKPDLLSQWRGYADDGQGFSIGFNVEYLEKLTADNKENRQSTYIIGKVLYEPEQHESALTSTYKHLEEVISSGNLKETNSTLLTSISEAQRVQPSKECNNLITSLYISSFDVPDNMYMLKNKAFSEEAEWRLVNYLGKTTLDPASFRASGNRIIPYKEFELKPLDLKAIETIYVGPKNITPDFVIKRF